MYQRYSDIMCSYEDRRDMYSFAKRIILSTRPHIRLYAVHQETITLLLTGVNKHLSDRNNSEMQTIRERQIKNKVEKPLVNKNAVIKILKDNLEFTVHSDIDRSETPAKFSSEMHSTLNINNVSIEKRDMNETQLVFKERTVDSAFFSQEESTFQTDFCDELKKSKKSIVEREEINNLESLKKTVSKCNKVNMYDSVFDCSGTTSLDRTMNSVDVLIQADLSQRELEWQDTFNSDFKSSEPIPNNQSFSQLKSSLPLTSKRNVQTIFNNCEDYPSSSASPKTFSYTRPKLSKKPKKSSTYVLKIVLNLLSESKPNFNTTIKSISKDKRTKKRYSSTPKKTTKYMCFKTLVEFKKTVLALLKQSLSNQASLKSQLMKVQQEMHILSENLSEGEQNYHMCMCLEKDDIEDIKLSKLSSTFSLVNDALEECSSTEDELLDIKKDLEVLTSRFMKVHLTDAYTFLM